jgi:hypothetical protein
MMVKGNYLGLVRMPDGKWYLAIKEANGLDSIVETNTIESIKRVR